MSWPLIQVGVVAAMTHAVRSAGDRLGPRLGALVLGLPSTTAVLLVSGGCEHGSAEAARAAELYLVGLVAAVALPLAYGWAVARGWGLRLAPMAGVAGFLGVTLLIRSGPDFGAWGGLGLAIAGVAIGSSLAGRFPDVGGKGIAWSGSRAWMLRSAVPAAFVLSLRGVRAAAGPEWAGALATFPAMSLAVLVSLQIEGGPGAVLALARSMPRGNLGMIAFLAAFRACCGPLGPIGAAAVGYLAVVVALTTLIPEGRGRAGVGGQRRRFAPRVERLGADVPGPRPCPVAAAMVARLADARGAAGAGESLPDSIVIPIRIPRSVPDRLRRMVA